VPRLFAALLGALQQLPRAHRRAGEENKAARLAYANLSALIGVRLLDVARRRRSCA
jgi:hypothetical protein